METRELYLVNYTQVKSTTHKVRKI